MLNELEVARTLMTHLVEFGGWEVKTSFDMERIFVEVVTETTQKVVIAANPDRLIVTIATDEEQITHKFVYTDSEDNVVDTVLAQLFN